MSGEKPEGISHNETVKYPCSSEDFNEFEDIIAGLRDISYEHLVVELESYPNHLQFIQTIRYGNDELYMIEVGIDTGKENPQIFRIEEQSLADCISIFKTVCINAASPDFSKWEDVTEEIFHTDCNFHKGFYHELADYVLQKFGLTEQSIRAMSEEELDVLWDKAIDNETDEACACEDVDNDDLNKNLILAEDFSDWLRTLCIGYDA